MTRQLLACLVVFIGAAASPVSAAVQARPPYRDPALDASRRAADLLARMTIEEKFWQLFMIPGSLDDPSHDYRNGVFGLQITVAGRAAGDPDAAGAARAHALRVNEIQRWFVERTRLGIPIIPFDEALHGLTREGATVFPQAIALAATWDTALMGRVATAIARETRSRGIRQVLSPVVNIATDVRWGRVEETYGEDPYLASMMTRAFVRAFERQGIITTPKHFVANVGEGGRDSYPIEDSRRRLEEIHFPPFRAALDEGARSIMTAYNAVDGLPATQSRWLLTDILKRAWRFNGFVISDAAATGGATVLHMTEASTATAATHALEAGLDVIFQSSWEQHRPWLEAFRSGNIADSSIDAAVTRVLRAKFEAGIFEHPFVDPDSAAFWNGSEAHRRLAAEAARASIVLLRNDAGVLPLPDSVRSVAIIGTDAAEARLGGYSGPGVRPVSLLEGIRDRLGPAANVLYAPGPGRISREFVPVPADRFTTTVQGRDTAGLSGEYFDNNALSGAPRVTRVDTRLDFQWTLSSPARGIPFDWYSARWTGRLAVPAEGVRRIGIEGNDGYRLWLDGRLLIDNWTKRSFGRQVADVDLAGGTSHTLRVEYFESTGNARVRLVWDAGADADWQARIDQAVSAARSAAVAIVVAGIEEGEFRDRASLSLPGHQEALIEAVAATGRPVVVVLVGGSAITMSRWIDRVQAVLHAWYPGEQGGSAVADVLFGDADPAGRLPMTWPMAEGQLPLVYNHKPTGRGDDYLDLTGHPLFPFGYGLSYTTFEYSGLRIEPAEIDTAGEATIRFVVRNSGSRAGDEVAQLYVRDVLASVSRPVQQLAGFQRIHLEPGEQAGIALRIGREHLEMLDRDLHRVVEPGRFRITVGSSSRDIRLRGELVVR